MTSTSTLNDDNELREHIRSLKVFQAASGNRYPDESTLRRFQKNWEEEIISFIFENRDPKFRKAPQDWLGWDTEGINPNLEKGNSNE